MSLDPTIDLERRALLWLRGIHAVPTIAGWESTPTLDAATAAGTDLVPVCAVNDPAAALVRSELGAAAEDHDGQVCRRLAGRTGHTMYVPPPPEV